MRPESAAFVWDAQRAASLVEQFVSGHVLDDYLRDPMLRSAVERQFEIIGEALNRLSRMDPGRGGWGAGPAENGCLPQRPPGTRYAVIDDRIAWEVATTRVSGLIDRLNRLLNDVAGTEHG